MYCVNKCLFYDLNEDVFYNHAHCWTLAFGQVAALKRGVEALLLLCPLLSLPELHDGFLFDCYVTSEWEGTTPSSCVFIGFTVLSAAKGVPLIISSMFCSRNVSQKGLSSPFAKIHFNNVMFGQPVCIFSRFSHQRPHREWWRSLCWERAVRAAQLRCRSALRTTQLWILPRYD